MQSDKYKNASWNCFLETHKKEQDGDRIQRYTASGHKDFIQL